MTHCIESFCSSFLAVESFHHYSIHLIVSMFELGCCCCFHLFFNRAHSFNLLSPHSKIAAMHRDFCRVSCIFCSQTKATTFIQYIKESQCSSLVIVATFLGVSIKADCHILTLSARMHHEIVASNNDFLKPP